MTAESSRQTRLHSWKEISAFMGCDARTCTRYEKEYGLPVYRVGGKKKGSVFAYREELEQWMASFARNGSAEKKASEQRRRPALVRALAAAGAAVFVLLTVNLLIDEGRSRPERTELHEDSLVVFGRGADPLWSRKFECRLHPLYSRSFGFHDLGRDREASLLFAYCPDDRWGLRAELYCFSRTGKELWKYRPGRVIRTAAEMFDDRYLVRQVERLELPEASPAVLVGASHSPWYMYEVALIDAGGRVLGRYWHAGHFTDGCLQPADLDGDGYPEVVCGGQNNDYDRACLVVLDPARLRGGSPQTADLPKRFLGIEPGEEKACVLLPRSCVADLYGMRNYVLDMNIMKDAGEIEVLVVEYEEPQRHFVLRCMFDFDLKLKSIKPEDHFLIKMKELRHEGKIAPEQEKLIFPPGEGLRRWDGSSWRVEPLPPIAF
jgi:hypothetical protein